MNLQITVLIKFYILLLLTIISVSCKNQLEPKSALTPTYSDFENDLEQRNLYGKVKELEKYKVTYQNGKDSNKPLSTLKEEFTELGKVLKTEYFDNNGETTQVDQYFYDKNNYLVKSISNNNLIKQKTVQILHYDTINKFTTRSVTIDDSLNFEYISTFSDKDILIKQEKIEGRDTVTRVYEYKYNDNNKIVLEKEIEKGKELSIITYKYNNKNQLTEYSNKNESIELITINNWDDNRIFKTFQYAVSPDLKRVLDEVTEYDRQYNPVNLKLYVNSDLHRELKYVYEFDLNGNWTKQTVSMKEYSSNFKKFIPIYLETRKIEYWN